MMRVTRDGRDFVVDADLVARLLKIGTEDLREGMRNGTITSRCEMGQDSDAGRWRLTFRGADRSCRLTVDDAGAVLKSWSAPTRARPAPGTPEN